MSRKATPIPPSNWSKAPRIAARTSSLSHREQLVAAGIAGSRQAKPVLLKLPTIHVGEPKADLTQIAIDAHNGGPQHNLTSVRDLFLCSPDSFDALRRGELTMGDVRAAVQAAGPRSTWSGVMKEKNRRLARRPAGGAQ